MLASGAFGYLFDYLIWWGLFLSLVLHTWCFFRLFAKDLSRSRLILGNLLIFLCFVGAAAMAGETYFRFIAVATDSFGMSLPARRWFALHTTLNSLGCRDAEWTPHKPEGVRRLAFVGDSFAYGWGLENPGDRFPDLIAARLNQESVNRIEVMNVAKPGWGTGDQIQPIADMIDHYAVDEVILCHVPNDIEKLIPRNPDFDPIRPPQPEFVNLESSPLLDFLYRRVYLPRVPTVAAYHDWLAVGYENPEIWNRQRQLYLEIIDICRERNVKLRVALLPFIKVGGKNFDQGAIHRRIALVFTKEQVPVVDLISMLSEGSPVDLVVNAADAHPNEKAHRLIAHQILTAFWPNSVLGAQPP